MDVALSQNWQLLWPNNSFLSWRSEAPWVGAGRLLQLMIGVNGRSCNASMQLMVRRGSACTSC